MTKIEKVMRELDDLFTFQRMIEKRKERSKKNHYSHEERQKIEKHRKQVGKGK